MHERGRRQTAIVACPKSMVGRVIGRNGETIKALQTFTGALIQIDQTVDPTKIAISGTPQSLNLALSMVNDIVRGNFKGFALLRQATGQSSRGAQPLTAKPVYAPGYGLIPPSQLYGGEGGVMLPGGGGLLPHASAGGPGGVQASAAGYPQLLGAGPQYVLQGVPPVAMGGPAGSPGGAVYSIVGNPAYSGPVYYPPLEFAPGQGMPLTHMAGASHAAAMGGGSSADLILVPEGSHLLGGAGSGGSAVVTGSRFFHSGGRGGAGQHAVMTAAGGGGLGGASAAGGGAAGAAGELLGQVAFAPATGGRGASAAGGHQRIGDVGLGMGMAVGGAAVGGGAAADVNSGLLPPNSLVMDADGALYTYNPDA